MTTCSARSQVQVSASAPSDESAQLNPRVHHSLTSGQTLVGASSQPPPLPAASSSRQSRSVPFVVATIAARGVSETERARCAFAGNQKGAAR